MVRTHLLLLVLVLRPLYLHAERGKVRWEDSVCIHLVRELYLCYSMISGVLRGKLCSWLLSGRGKGLAAERYV